MLPIHYQVVGEEDYALVISINHDGKFSFSSGTYTSEHPRSGQLTVEQETQIVDAIHNLGVPEEHAMPEGAADAFKAQLTLGEENNKVIYPFWEGALEEDSKLLKLIRILEMI